MRACIARVQTVKAMGKRWNLWQEAWKEYPESLALRRVIHEDLADTLVEVAQQINTCLEQTDVDGALQVYQRWMIHLRPLADAWHTAAAAPGIWRLASRLYDALIHRARDLEGDVPTYRRALELIATIPVDALQFLSVDAYLEAIQAVAENFERQDNLTAAAALVDYGLYVVECSGQLVIDNYIAYALHEHASRLYESLAHFGRAYQLLHRVRGCAPGEQRKSLNHQLWELRTRSEATGAVEMVRNWCGQCETLLAEPDFCSMVEPSLFRQFLRHISDL